MYGSTDYKVVRKSKGFLLFLFNSNNDDDSDNNNIKRNGILPIFFPSSHAFLIHGSL